MTSRIWIGAALVGALACGGDDDRQSSPDGGGRDIDAAALPDEPDAAPNPFEMPTPFAVGLSPLTPDQLQSAVAGPEGTFYAAGHIASALDPLQVRTVVVIQLDADGLVTSFGGGDGIATTPLDFRGGSDEIDIVVQPSGAIVVSATVADAETPLDRNIALARLTDEGQLDTSFGEEGVLVIDLNSALIDGTTVTGADSTRGLAVDASGRLYVHAVQRGEGDGGTRTDTDFATVRILADGSSVDAAFADGGKHLVDIRGAEEIRSNATAKGIHVLEDGGVIAGGYATTAGLGDGPQPVLYALDADGAPIDGFASGGLFHSAVLSIQTEVYNFAVHGTHLVTAGYGRDSGEQNDWVSLRFDVETGARDLAWGGAPGGAVLIDPSGTMVGDNCRNAIPLPEGKTLLIGSTGPSNEPAQDAAFAVLDAEGRLDTAYGDGCHVLPLGGGAGGNDQLWGAAVSGGNILIVGTRGGGPIEEQTSENNDDAYAVLLPIR